MQTLFEEEPLWEIDAPYRRRLRSLPTDVALGALDFRRIRLR